jgi:hypothetical protein
MSVSIVKHRKILLVLTAISGVLIVSAGVYRHLCYGPTTFDSAVWLQGEKAEFSSKAPRLRMADGLVRSGLLIGKTRLQIEALLGPPAQAPNPWRADMIYWLGPERSFIRIDSEWLAIRFGEAGDVCDVRIVRD